MRHQLTKFGLMSLLFAPAPSRTTIADSDGRLHTGIFIAAERADGSGRAFNVTMRQSRQNTDGPAEWTFHATTTD